MRLNLKRKEQQTRQYAKYDYSHKQLVQQLLWTQTHPLKKWRKAVKTKWNNKKNTTILKNLIVKLIYIKDIEIINFITGHLKVLKDTKGRNWERGWNKAYSQMTTNFVVLL